MTAKATAKPSPVVIGRNELNKLLDELKKQGRTVIGPALRDGSVVLSELNSVDELPAGWTDRQAPGQYRLQKRKDKAVFGYNCPPQSWKRYLHEPRATLWQGSREGMKAVNNAAENGKFAFFGVRACELAAIAIQDRVLLEGPYVDAGYARRRKNVVIIAVNCTEAGGTCFCTSMGSGPKASGDFDVCLTELTTGEHRFLVETGSKRGEELLAAITHRKAESADVSAAEDAIQKASKQMGRTLDTTGLREALYEGVDHPRWNEVAARCLNCANCTLVCPTCFCTTMEDTTDLSGATAQRVRRWDSCFTLDFSYIHGGSVRSTARARYRHWLTHKLGTWVDQFGTPGCVGCGRCITWCPVGIDITEEAAAVRHRSVTNEVLDGND